MAKLNHEKHNAQITAAAIAALIESGATKTDHTYEYAIETRAGLLRLNARSNNSCPGTSVFARFDDVQKAIEVFGPLLHLNVFSGKWNHHYFTPDVSPASVAYVVSDLKRQLARVRAS